MSQQPGLDAIDPEERLPDFISPRNINSPFFYFHHRVSASGTLIVEVLGPNLTFKFTHSRARRFWSPFRIVQQLERKAAGFLTLVTSDGKRTVLASAISGHGLGNHVGDVLDRQPGVLSNAVWTKRVIAMSHVLGINLARPWDGRWVKEEHRGCFQGSHVEVKLAVHSIFVLLDMFSITKDLNNITLEHLERLRDVRLQDGSPPVFEVYFSRKNCGACGNLVRRLADATGVTIRLCWKQRLERKEYPTCSIRVRPTADRTAPVMEIDDQDLDFGDEPVSGNDDSDVTEAEEIKELEVVDLTSNESAPSPRPSPIPLCTPSPSPEHEPDPIDNYLDGLSYRVGQIESCPQGAVTAIVQFARKMRAQYASRLPAAIRDGRSINKPLPATPVTEAPAWEPERREAISSPLSRRNERRAAFQRTNASPARHTVPRRRAPRPLRGTSSVPRGIPPLSSRSLNARSLRPYTLSNVAERLNGTIPARTRSQVEILSRRADV